MFMANARSANDNDYHNPIPALAIYGHLSPRVYSRPESASRFPFHRFVLSLSLSFSLALLAYRV
jgi:hypothetical protein